MRHAGASLCRVDSLTMEDRPLWTPSPERVAAAHLTHFARAVRAAHPDVAAPDEYESLRRWSVDRPAEFWPAVWRYTGIVAEGPGGDARGDEVVVGADRMAPPDATAGPRWFPRARLNYAENLLRFRDERDAIVAWDERGRQRTLSYAALYAEVSRIAAALRREGVGVGDRVAGCLPNGPEAIVAMLATASLGAVWSSCSPDFGATGVLDRFGQIAPVVLFAVDGYQFNGQWIDTRERVREVARQLPSVRRVVMVEQAGARRHDDGTAGADARITSWAAFTASGDVSEAATIRFERLPFDHPLFVMYSSGTTGLPKGIVHGAGGTLLQHLKELVLHTDLRRDDRIMYFTTCGWMMWNWVVSSLAVGATIVCYDGSPLPRRRAGALWDVVQAERITVFGTSAKWIALTEKAGLRPRETHDLVPLRTILSTGSPLAPAGFDYVYRDVKADVHLASISGGTDIISCFALGVPTRPVWRGELQARGLGMAVEVWDDGGRPITGTPGELVCTRPFPSMPVGFWNDSDGAKYRAAYFEHFPGVWRHGDWAELTPRGGMVILGRSDATLNPAGVRIGTAEIYRQVEQLPEVVESVAVGQATGFGDVRVVLFVRLQDGIVLDNPLRDRIRDRIRSFASPHHVPKKVIQVADIPRTISGKISEIAVRETIHGRAVSNTDALANPEALLLYRDLPALRDGG